MQKVPQVPTLSLTEKEEQRNFVERVGVSDLTMVRMRFECSVEEISTLNGLFN